MGNNVHQFDWVKPDWSAPENVVCVSTTRRGGASQGKFASLNLSAHVADNVQYVKTNRELLVHELQLPGEPIWLDQQHGKQIIKLTSTRANNIRVDAAYATEPGRVCTVLTADCLPVLFCDREGSCVAAAHAGWRGLLNGVLESTLKAFPVGANKVLCWLGPAIGPSKFEVGAELKQMFVNKDHRHEVAFQPSQAGKYLANIYQLAKNILTTNGVDAIFGGGYCTYTEKERFFSYRRDGASTGRMAAVIWLKS